MDKRMTTGIVACILMLVGAIVIMALFSATNRPKAMQKIKQNSINLRLNN